MARNLWIERSKTSDKELEEAIKEFLSGGGEIINTSNFSEKKNSDTAIKLGKVHRQLKAAGKE